MVLVHHVSTSIPSLASPRGGALRAWMRLKYNSYRTGRGTAAVPVLSCRRCFRRSKCPAVPSVSNDRWAIRSLAKIAAGDDVIRNGSGKVVTHAILAAAVKHSFLAAAACRRASESFGLPSRLPRALAAFRAADVRELMISRSCWATAARIWMVNLLACGLSTATNQRAVFRPRPPFLC